MRAGRRCPTCPRSTSSATASRRWRAGSRWPRPPAGPPLDGSGTGKRKGATWFALPAPAGTPPAIIGKLRDWFVTASHDPELKRRLDENGTPIATSTPEEMREAMVQEWQTMRELARTLNLRQQ